jgi:hypothetical protein
MNSFDSVDRYNQAIRFSPIRFYRKSEIEILAMLCPSPTGNVISMMYLKWTSRKWTAATFQLRFTTGMLSTISIHRT